MKTNARTGTVLLSIATAIVSLTAPSRAEDAAATPAETPAQHDARMGWWRDARFGMFVHWGLYSGLAGTWQGKTVGTHGGMEWIEDLVGADTDTYAKAAIPLFQPKPDFAKDWAALAKSAGCRYVVFTTKHHEGFALHDSKVSTYTAGAVLHRDLVKEIVGALHEQGLRVGFYHSLIDWHHDQYEYNRSKQLPHPLRGKPYPNGTRDQAKYLEYLFGEVNELMSNYGPVDVLWWDYSAEDFGGEEAWHAFELMKLVREKQPNIVMNNRLFRTAEAGWTGMGTANYANHLNTRFGDFVTPEQHIPATGMPGVDWETCMTINTTWGYSDHDHNWKSSETLIHNLVDVVSKGGNYLLNIGPKGDGTIPTEIVTRMHDIGAWMDVNGDSIYGTTANPLGPVAWGRVTAKPGKLYLHIFNWPADGKLLVPVKAGGPATFLAGDKYGAITVKSTDAGTELTLPGKAVDPVDTVVVLNQ